MTMSMSSELLLLCGLLFFPVLAGLVLYRVLAVRLFSADEFLSEFQLLTQGLFFSLVLIGAVAQHLAIVYLFRAWVFITVFIVIMILFRGEAKAVVLGAVSMPMRFFARVRKGHLAEPLAWFLVLLVMLLHLPNVLVPSAMIDIWVYHIPIPESIIKNNGFIYPFFDHLYYANGPSFVELLFSIGLRFTNNFNIAGLIQYFVFTSFFLCVASFVGRGRFALLIAFVFIFSDNLFLGHAPTPKTDAARAVFSVGAILFFARYAALCTTADRLPLDAAKARYHLFFGAVLCGAAVGSKYLEIFTVIVCLGLFALTFRPERAFYWNVALFVIGGFLCADFWYLKNLIVYKNPTYPLIFGHEGISKEAMASFYADPMKAYDPAHRHYIRDSVLNWKSWRDLLIAVPKMLYSSRVPAWFLLFPFLGAILFKDRFRRLMLLSSVAFMIFWYFAVFHAPRYGITPGLLLLSTAALFLTAPASDPGLLGFMERIRALITRRRWVAGVVIFLAFVFLIRNLHTGRSIRHIVNTNRGLWQAVTGKIKRVDILGRSLSYYAVYSYVMERGATNVLNPWDNGAAVYSMYLIPTRNRETTFVSYRHMPKKLSDMDKFITKTGARYYIHLGSLSPLALERLTDKHVAKARAMHKAVLKRAKKVYSDGRGNVVYELRR